MFHSFEKEKLNVILLSISNNQLQKIQVKLIFNFSSSSSSSSFCLGQLVEINMGSKLCFWYHLASVLLIELTNLTSVNFKHFCSINDFKKIHELVVQPSFLVQLLGPYQKILVISCLSCLTVY